MGKSGDVERGRECKAIIQVLTRKGRLTILFQTNGFSLNLFLERSREGQLASRV